MQEPEEKKGKKNQIKIDARHEKTEVKVVVIPKEGWASFGLTPTFQEYNL